MTQWLHRDSRGPRAASRTSWGAMLLMVGLATPALVQAADNNVQLILSMKPLTQQQLANGDTRRQPDTWSVRPNVEQELYTYLQIDDPSKKPTVVVQLAAGGVEISSETIKAEKKFIQVKWPRLEEGAKNAPKLPQQLRNPIELRLVVDGKPLEKTIKLDIYRPYNYLNCETPSVDENKNRLVFVISPQSDMNAEILSPEPPCQVELVLDPDRIPGLTPTNRKRVWSGNVTPARRDDSDKDRDSLYLVTDDVRLRSSSSPGVVTLNADGFNRAFRYRIASTQEDTLQIGRITRETILHINAPSVADPSKTVPMTFEADNVDKPENKLLVLEALTFVDKEGKKHYSRIAEFSGDREIRWTCTGGGLHGGLRLQPDVKDWSSKVDLSGFHGEVTLRLRLLNTANKNQPKNGADPDKEDGTKKVQEATKTIILDTTRPEVISFEPLPPGAVRGKPFVVRAKGLDGESGIRDVVFFLGKYPPNAKLPDDVILVPGTPGTSKQSNKEESSTWTAELIAASDVRNPLDVSVRFTNNAGLSTTKSIAVEVANPPPPPPGAAVGVKRASIAGVVMEGDRPQPALNVDLLGPMGKVLLSMKTAADGTFLFKDLLPGDYQVSSVKVASNTRGVAPAQPFPLAAGEAKTGVTIKLYRQ